MALLYNRKENPGAKKEDIMGFFFGDGGFDIEDFILMEMILEDEEEERNRLDELDEFDELDGFGDF